MLRIAICGLDGIGKTTLIENLKERCTKSGVSIAKTRVSFTCKSLMENIEFEELNEFEVVRRIGMMFDFAEHYRKLDADADVLLCDRYDIDFEVLNDTYNIPQNFKDIMHSIYMRAPRLDLCFYLRADYTLAAERLDSRGNRKENESDNILMRMQKSFDRRIKDYPGAVIMDATKTAEEIADEAFDNIVNGLKKQ